MNTLKVGFAKENINPPMGIPIRGYYVKRFADGILDNLEAIALALKVENVTTLLICIDNCAIKQELNAEFRKSVSDATGVPAENIILSATHTHTGPSLDRDLNLEIIENYIAFVNEKITSAAIRAIADLKNAKMGYGKGVAPNVAFCRRYIMKDGSTKTNPGVNNPDIVKPLREADETVSVIRFDREDADTIVFVNFANHPDVIGGCKISADWPGLLRQTVEKVLDNTKCIFFNGAQGDINHVNVRPKPGDFNGMFNDFDDVSRGYDHARYIARVVTGGVLQAYDKVNYIDAVSLGSIQKKIYISSNKPAPEQLPEAHRIFNLHNEGKDNELPYTGMMLTTIVAEATRMVRLENAPDAFEMILSAIAIGPVAIIGIPGEPFAGIGAELKKTPGFDMIIPCCLTNGAEGYFPMQDSYDEGGYEARSSRFKAGVAEHIIEEGKKIIESLVK